MIDYATIKALAKQTGQRVTDLFVLAPQNDPFYTGTPTDLANAEWFTDLWRRFGYSDGVHLRRVHYQIVSQDPKVLTPNGLPYENTEGCWDLLGRAASSARYLGWVNPGAFEDHRAPAPMLYTPESVPPAYIGVYNVDEDEDATPPGLPDFPRLPGYGVPNYEGVQRYHVEVWAEKSTQNDILIPLCEEYGVNLQTGLGELSITACYDVVARRIAEDGRPARLLYVSDYDPGGRSMPVAAARKIEYFIRQQYPHLDARLIPVVLTTEQVHAYRLPKTPLKASEKRARAFEERFGKGGVELDALEALHPGTLRRIIQAEILRYYDPYLSARVAEAKRQLRRDLQTEAEAIMGEHADEIASLQVEYEQVRAEFEARIADHTARRTALWQTLTEEMAAAAPAINDYPIPEADEGNEHDHVQTLYDSNRDYLEQLAAYKAFQGKGGADADEAVALKEVG